MSDDERRRWDERYRSGEYQSRPTAGAFLESWLPRLPVGRALDVACGAGRNAIRLAEAGHQVDAIDISAVGIDMAKAAATDRGLDINWIVADLDRYEPEPGTYDLITVIRFVNRSLWPKLITALQPNGWLLIEHHMQTNLDVDGPSSPDFRLQPQELLQTFGSLRVVYYEETVEPADHPASTGERFANARIVACKGSPGF